MIDRDAINTEVRAMERLDLEGLRSAWRARYGPAPKLRSRKLRTETSAGRSSLDLAPGTALTREWKGVPETVRRTEAGYEWQGRTYRSLTAVARAISGGPRSGPLFFGLKGAA